MMLDTPRTRFPMANKSAENIIKQFSTLTETYLHEKERIAVLDSYLVHESSKFRGAKFENATEKIENRLSLEHASVFQTFQKRTAAIYHREHLQKTIQAMDLIDKLMLMHALSYGVLHKILYTCIVNPAHKWRMNQIESERLVFGTSVAGLDCRRPTFTQVINHMREQEFIVFRNGRNSYFAAGELADRVSDPLIARYRENGQSTISDGNGRTLIFIYSVIENGIMPPFYVAGWESERRAFRDNEMFIYEQLEQTIFPVRLA